MVQGAATLNGGLHSRIVESKIRSKIGKRCRHAFLLILFIFNNFKKIGRWTSCASNC